MKNDKVILVYTSSHGFTTSSFLDEVKFYNTKTNSYMNKNDTDSVGLIAKEMGWEFHPMTGEKLLLLLSTLIKTFVSSGVLIYSENPDKLILEVDQGLSDFHFSMVPKG